MIAKHYGKSYTLQRLREISGINRVGVSLFSLCRAAEKIGFKTDGIKVDLGQLSEIKLPCILHWEQNHFVVLYKIKRGRFYIADPAKSLISYSKKEFLQSWATGGETKGIAVLLLPTSLFFDLEGQESKPVRFGYMLQYLIKYRKLITQLLFSLTLASLLQLIVPFLTQSVVDIGIKTKNLNFVYIVLAAQIMLFIGRVSVDFMRSWILLHVSTRINLLILTDFLIKLMKLPMSFFDTRMTGDLMQRINDQKRIETFLTGPTLSGVFSVLNLILFTIVLAYYELKIFFVFLLGSLLYTFWVSLFLKKRKELDFKRFVLASRNQGQVVQLINGMQDIKLNNCERTKRWEWEETQGKMFSLNMKNLSLSQYQQAGAFFINEGKNIFITFIAAKSVIDGNVSLGGMMAIQYIIGQLNSPIEQLISFIQQMQDARISLERLNEIYTIEDEEPSSRTFVKELPMDKSITFNNVNFAYPGNDSEPVLKKINLFIPEGKTTAIVGMSGSGKTTILKLLLRFYDPQDGEINIGNEKLNQIGHRYWRDQCGIVMQDGFVFSDSIVGNIAVGEKHPDKGRLLHAIDVANINDLIESLPLGLDTVIGAEGNAISHGQKQRLLIARIVYKNPEYVFFDEATNALDANNESIIMDNLEKFLKGKTVVIIAHRLSTVRNANNIIVLDRGIITEQGSHEDLIKERGGYYRLVKNQLELGG
jgi:ATP-binding cassette subfamily B protein